MDKIKIDFARAQELVNLAIAQRGEDYLYNNPHRDSYYSDEYNPREYADPATPENFSGGPACLYVHKKRTGELEAGCLVGLALNIAGVPLEEFDQHNHDGASEWIYQSKTVEATEKAQSFLLEVQQRQDQGLSWGAARDASDRTYMHLSDRFNDEEN